MSASARKRAKNKEKAKALEQQASVAATDVDLEISRLKEAADAAAASELKMVERAVKAQADLTAAQEKIATLEATLKHERSESKKAMAVSLQALASAESRVEEVEQRAVEEVEQRHAAAMATAQAEVATLREELEVIGMAAVKSATESDGKVATLIASLEEATERAEAAEARAARAEVHAASTAEMAETMESASVDAVREQFEAKLAEAAAEVDELRARRLTMEGRLEAAQGRFMEAHAAKDGLMASTAKAVEATRAAEERAAAAEAEVLRLTTALAEANAASLVEAPTSSRTSLVPPTPMARVIENEDQVGLSPAAGEETPNWLREAGGRAHDEAAEAAEAQKEEKRLLADAEAKARAAEAEAAAAAADAREAKAAAKALKVKCAELEKVKDGLANDKAQLVAEIAQHAGHLNHKQKIQYVSKLKLENDELREQLKRAKGAELKAARPVDKENRRAIGA